VTKPDSLANVTLVEEWTLAAPLSPVTVGLKLTKDPGSFFPVRGPINANGGEAVVNGPGWPATSKASVKR